MEKRACCGISLCVAWLVAYLLALQLVLVLPLSRQQGATIRYVIPLLLSKPNIQWLFQFKFWFIYFLFGFVAITLGQFNLNQSNVGKDDWFSVVVEVYYLNVALALFNTGQLLFLLPVSFSLITGFFSNGWDLCTTFVIRRLPNLYVVTPTYYVICKDELFLSSRFKALRWFV